MVIRIRKPNIVQALLILLVMYAQNPFYYVHFGFVQRGIYYLFAVGIVGVIFTLRYITLESFEKRFIDLFLVFLFGSFLVPLITGSNDFEFAKYLIRYLVNGLFFIAIYKLWENLYAKHLINKSYAEIYVNAFELYIASTVFFLVFPSLRTSYTSLVNSFDRAELLSRGEYLTRVGFAGFTGFKSSLIAVICLCLIIYLYSIGYLKYKNFLFHVFFVSLGCIFYGRIGILAGIAVFLAASIILAKNGNYKLIILFLLFIALSIVIISYILSHLNSVNMAIVWMIEPIINRVTRGEFVSASSNELLYMYQNFNPSKMTFFFGDGYWTTSNGRYYAKVDVEFMRYIYYGGIGFTILLYCCVIAVIMMIGFKANKGSRLLLVITLGITALLYCLKGDSSLAFTIFSIPIYIFLKSGSCYNSEITDG